MYLSFHDRSLLSLRKWQDQTDGADDTLKRIIEGDEPTCLARSLIAQHVQMGPIGHVGLLRRHSFHACYTTLPMELPEPLSDESNNVFLPTAAAEVYSPGNNRDNLKKGYHIVG